ncbi:dephospho-CoA kinase [uncultured Sphaerochaeta sp.]|uniref:dephospho-CoA kinase n=1 Tax=uncultured Sphaerochaeta sp. TaxID=886478 RepID=UPI0029CA18CC|nr:dephospho-CoA kinase [uncultured Sphaerochaeta sp.]
MMVIGLTGRACAGKDQYAEIFASFGCQVVDVDSLGHDALNESIKALKQAFGQAVVCEGKVDRKALGKLVFSNPVKLRELESITHPKMVETCKRLIREAGEEQKPALILNAALLKRMGLEPLCDHVLFIKAPLLLRFFRCRRREGLSLGRFLEREHAQLDIVPETDVQGLDVVALGNHRSKKVIHRQVITYCDTIGLEISSQR